MHARWPKDIAELEAFCKEEWEKISNTRIERLLAATRSVCKLWYLPEEVLLSTDYVGCPNFCRVPQWWFYLCSIYDIKNNYAIMVAENIVFFHTLEQGCQTQIHSGPKLKTRSKSRAGLVQCLLTNWLEHVFPHSPDIAIIFFHMETWTWVLLKHIESGPSKA